MKNRVLVSIAIVVCLLVLGTGLGLFTSKYYHTDAAAKPEIEGLLWPNPKQIMPFTAIDHKGNLFGLEQLTGKWSLVFFGYTHCPDVCPITLSVLNQVHQKLAEQKAENNIQIIFASVDPERDTKEQLASYIEYFNKAFIGLGGTEQQIASLGQQMGIVYFRGEKSSSGEYVVDHTASVFLIDPLTRWVALFSTPLQADNIVNRFLAIQDFINGQI
ncbi:MAG: SCO family protein [Gammaproteobacteria bacterium]|nr:SCO family protein [Gammaproteobacteria bacterium]